MVDPTLLSASDAAAAIRAKTLTSLELVDACLARIANRDDAVGAWAYLDADAARAAARACDATAPLGPLHGVPVGVKDVIDTKDMPTAYGSAMYAGHQPTRDAACVSLVKRAGGIVLGKTVSTEFAMFHPNQTANPHNFAHTPGGSSSGSAASVADYHVPLAFGTQTSGSIIRPAAFCGVVGYKPSFGTFAIEGVKTLGASLDTLGFISRSVGDLMLMSDALHGQLVPSSANTSTKPVIAYWRPPYAEVDPASDGLDRALTRLRQAGFQVEALTLPETFRGLNDVHVDVMGYEVSRNHAFEDHAERRHLMGERTRQIIEEGWTLPHARYLIAKEQTRAARLAFDSAMQGIDALLVPSAIGEAPLGLSATGDPAFNKLWTLLGVPAITLPIGVGALGLPVGVQLIARLDQDAALMQAATKIEAVLQTVL